MHESDAQQFCRMTSKPGKVVVVGKSTIDRAWKYGEPKSSLKHLLSCSAGRFEGSNLPALYENIKNHHRDSASKVEPLIQTIATNSL